MKFALFWPYVLHAVVLLSEDFKDKAGLNVGLVRGRDDDVCPWFKDKSLADDPVIAEVIAPRNKHLALEVFLRQWQAVLICVLKSSQSIINQSINTSSFG